MRKISLGNTGIQVSVLCLGTMYFGSTVNESTLYAILDELVNLASNPEYQDILEQMRNRCDVLKNRYENAALPD